MAASTSQGRSRSTSRPRLWVPGLLYVSAAGELCVGPHVGFGEPSRAFRYTPAGRHQGVDDWTHRAWLVERSSLRPSLVDEHAIILPETLVDRDHQPHAWRWLAAQPLVCVSGLKVTRLVDAGLRVFTVEYDTDGTGRFRLTATGGATARTELSAPLATLLAAGTDAQDTRPTLDQHFDPSLVDRVLRELSGGALTEQSVVHALAARLLVEDGYGYRGERAGEFRTVEAIMRDVRGLDALFRQIYARAEEHRDDAKAIRAALPTALVDADQVDIPFYGTARRVSAPALRVPSAAAAAPSDVHLLVNGEELGELELPPVDRWFVEGVTDWSPTLPPALEQELAADRASHSTSAAKLVALFVLAAALVTAAAIALSLTR